MYKQESATFIITKGYKNFSGNDMLVYVKLKVEYLSKTIEITHMGFEKFQYIGSDQQLNEWVARNQAINEALILADKELKKSTNASTT